VEETDSVGEGGASGSREGREGESQQPARTFWISSGESLLPLRARRRIITAPFALRPSSCSCSFFAWRSARFSSCIMCSRRE